MKTKLILTIVLFGFFSTCFCQQDTTWNKWTWLSGDWVGEGNGTPGQGEGFFSFKAELDKNILVRKSHTVYPATEKKPEIIHDDLMVIYPVTAESRLKAIYFDNEGHVINYIITFSDKSIVFTSEKSQNAPIFKLTYTLIETESVNVKFEISQDGEKFFTYVEGKSKKKK